MKHFHALFPLLLFSFSAAAQEAPAVTTDANGHAQLVQVLTAPGTQDELFLRAKDWVFKTYNSGKTVEQYEDKAAGKLVVHARTVELAWKAGLGIVNDAGAFTYNMALEVKDGKARMTVDNIVYKQGEMKNAMLVKSGADLADAYPANWPRMGLKSMTAHWNEMQNTTKADLVALAASFTKAMSAPAKSKDW